MSESTTGSGGLGGLFKGSVPAWFGLALSVIGTIYAAGGLATEIKNNTAASLRHDRMLEDHQAQLHGLQAQINRLNQMLAWRSRRQDQPLPGQSSAPAVEPPTGKTDDK